MRYEQIIAIGNAIEKKDYDKLYDIIAEPNFDINQVGRCDWTPLFVAVKHADKKMVEIFLKMGANSNAVLSANDYPSVLTYTVEQANKKENAEKRKEYLEIMTCLLQNGAKEIQSRINKQTTLHIAATYGDRESVGLLVNFGFHPEQKDEKGKTPIDLAMFNGHDELAKELSNQNIKNIKLTFFSLNHGKIEKFSDKKGILAAAIKNDTNALECALKDGYVVNDPLVHDFKGTPLEYAVKNNNPAMAKLLIRYGSILSDGAFTNAKTPEMREILLTAKKMQLEILKKELKLEDKNPNSCALK